MKSANSPSATGGLNQDLDNKVINFAQRPEINLGNEQLDKVASDIWDIRYRFQKKLIEKSPEEDKSSKSKNKRGKGKKNNATMSAGKKSMNDSVIENSADGITGLSGGDENPLY